MTRDETEDETGVLGRLRSLVELLAEMDDRDERLRTGEGTRRGTVGVDYGYSVRVGGAVNGPPRAPTGDARSVLTDVRYGDGYCVVTADLPGVEEGEASAALDERAGVLELLVGGEPIDRIPLRYAGATITDVTFNNRILQARVEFDDG